MSNYYINVVHGYHEGGTKFYDMYGLISVDPTTEEKRIVTIQNWGIVGVVRVGIHRLSGQFKIGQYENESAALADTHAIRVSKERRGYGFEVNTNIFSDNNRDKFAEALKEFALGKERFLEICEFLIPGFSPEITVDTSKSRTENVTKPKPVINDPLWGTW